MIRNRPDRANMVCGIEPGVAPYTASARSPRGVRRGQMNQDAGDKIHVASDNVHVRDVYTMARQPVYIYPGHWKRRYFLRLCIMNKAMLILAALAVLGVIIAIVMLRKPAATQTKTAAPSKTAEAWEHKRAWRNKGNDIDVGKAMTIDDAKKACAAEVSCKGFTYYEADKKAWLHNALTSQEASPANDLFIKL